MDFLLIYIDPTTAETKRKEFKTVDDVLVFIFDRRLPKHTFKIMDNFTGHYIAIKFVGSRT